ncbi:5'-nucleotidase [soil metagenome]
MISKALIICFLILFCSCRNEPLQSVEIQAERINIDASIKANEELENFIRPYSDHINRTLDSVLAYNPDDLNKSDGELNTALGNLMADIVMEQANPVFKSRTGNDIDLVLLNHGGIRSTVGKGDITSRTAYSLMPFENEIVVAEITGEKVQEMLSYLEKNKTAHPISGIEIKMSNNYRITSAKINGREIEPSKNYFVATSDYLQQGGDNMIFFEDPVGLYRVDYKIRNAIIDYFGKVDTIRTARDNRYIRSN